MLAVRVRALLLERFALFRRLLCLCRAPWGKAGYRRVFQARNCGVRGILLPQARVVTGFEFRIDLRGVTPAGCVLQLGRRAVRKPPCKDWNLISGERRRQEPNARRPPSSPIPRQTQKLPLLAADQTKPPAGPHNRTTAHPRRCANNGSRNALAVHASLTFPVAVTVIVTGDPDVYDGCDGGDGESGNGNGGVQAAAAASAPAAATALLCLGPSAGPTRGRYHH
ncbi:hypothetical protein ANO11243_016570 [Dothideomycetidae sp. 11243]|nr:hypothetical protein ANO11243_016570 [fungal sp. No.11243]